MNKNDKNTNINKSVAPSSSIGSLMSFDEFDRFFDDFLSRRWPRLSDLNAPKFGLETGLPKVDIIDHDKEIEVQAALPGVKKEDIDVSINNQTITIRTSTKKEKKKDGSYFRREITQGEYQRTLSFPDYVDYDNAKASFKDGLLKVTIPKTKKGNHKNKRVEIK